jgi:hypothetical protein
MSKETSPDPFLSTVCFGKSDPRDLDDGGDNLETIDFEKAIRLNDDVANPAVELVQKLSGRGNPFVTREQLVPAPNQSLAKSTKVKDGQVVEMQGKQKWTYHYRDGRILGSKLEDPDLPGGMMHFDQHGNEISGEKHEALLKEPAIKAAAAIVDLTEDLAKIIGVHELELR